jgi:1-acyl-sn-glycerol-3-phosphate acyltransferase
VAAERTSVATRIARFARLIGHLLGGLATLIFVFPRRSEHQRRAIIQRWARDVLKSIDVTLDARGVPEPFPDRCLLVLNHISWLDILLVAAVCPAKFIAKEEIRRWPVVGALVTRSGTLYIDRGSYRALRHVNERLAEALASGMVIACFPEGTTTFGHGLGPFHAGLFQPAIDGGGIVLPVALSYRDAHGNRTEASAYVGDDSFMKSVLSVLATPVIHARLDFLEPMDANGRDRRDLAQKARSEIGYALFGSPGVELERRHGT